MKVRRISLGLEFIGVVLAPRAHLLVKEASGDTPGGLFAYPGAGLINPPTRVAGKEGG
jgi:hypothetical protein